MSKMTEKNTDRNLSDYLPPALVKDWRQFLRSRMYIALFLLLQLVGWFFFIRAASAEKLSAYAFDTLHTQLFYLGVLVLCIIVPYRAGSSVSSDTKVRGTNFLMLTPLSARRIVWGTWCSSALQVLLAALLALPLLFACRQLEADAQGAPFNWEYLGRDLTLLSLMTLCGWVMASVFMFTAGLARFFRISLVLGATIFMTTLFGASLFTRNGIWSASLPALIAEHPFAFCMLLGHAIAIFVLLLELTRRHYAAPAENCSASVRLLSVLPMLVYLILMAVYGDEPVKDSDGLIGLSLHATEGPFAAGYLIFALVADALLPTYAMPVHSRRAWPWLPACLQVPGIVPSTICILLGLVIAALPTYACGANTPLFSAEGISQRLEHLAVYGTNFVNLAYSLLFWLLVTDILCRRSNRNRPVIYGFVALITLSLSQVFTRSAISEMYLPLANTGTRVSSIHFNWRAGFETFEDILPQLTECYIAGTAALAVVVALLILWRGRVQKG